MQVSRSGQIRRPCSQTSSPVFTTAVTSCGDSRRRRSPSACFTPSRNRAPPTPPTTTTTFTLPILARAAVRQRQKMNAKLPYARRGSVAADGS